MSPQHVLGGARQVWDLLDLHAESGAPTKKTRSKGPLSQSNSTNDKVSVKHDDSPDSMKKHERVLQDYQLVELEVRHPTIATSSPITARC